MIFNACRCSFLRNEMLWVRTFGCLKFVFPSRIADVLGPIVFSCIDFVSRVSKFSVYFQVMVADKFNLFGCQAVFEKSMNILTSSVTNKKLHCVAPVFSIFDAYFSAVPQKKALKNYHNSMGIVFGDYFICFRKKTSKPIRL